MTPEALPQLVDPPTVVQLTRSPRGRDTLRPWAALAAIAVRCGGWVRGRCRSSSTMPLLNPDELRYTLAARGAVDGEWLNLRGHAYGYGPVYPLVLAPILWLSDGMANAYPYFKLVNALLFVLAAVPIYALARRLLSEWWSVGVAAMCLAIPSSIYTSLILTESASYLMASTASLAVVLALERPSRPASAGADRSRRARRRDASAVRRAPTGLPRWSAAPLGARQPTPASAPSAPAPLADPRARRGHRRVRPCTPARHELAEGGVVRGLRRPVARLRPRRQSRDSPSTTSRHGSSTSSSSRSRSRPSCSSTCCAPPAAAPSGRVRSPPRSSP